jgi:subtilisin family serine protease
MRPLIAAGLALVFWQTAGAGGASQSASVVERPLATASYHPGRILVRPKAGVSLDQLDRFHSARRCRVVQTFGHIGRLQIVSLPEGPSVPQMLRRYQESGLVEFAEPDYIGQTFATIPNDPGYSKLWGLGAIQAPAAWDVLTSASNILVAVLDTGVRYTHQDLTANMWTNASGSYGLNAIAGTANPMDDSGHGTMVAGVIGAVGNNGVGVAGAAWRVKLMACKCADNYGRVYTSAAVACLDYARTNNARIVNASWGLTDSLALSNAVWSLRDAGIILVAASGNSGQNIDTNPPPYPAGYRFDNVISVGATTSNDVPWLPSNFGATNVHLAAPGDQIYSTYGATDNFYYTLSGTSFSAAYASGALALMLVKYPAETPQEIVGRLVNAVDPLPSLAGKCVTGGRLNLRKALSPELRLLTLPRTPGGLFQLRVAYEPARTCVIEAGTNLANWFPVYTNTTSAAGTYDFIDPASTNLAARCYRAVALPVPIRLTALPAASDGRFRLRVCGGANRTCVIQASTNLLAGWSSIFTNTTAVDGTFDFADPASTNLLRRCYRATAGY